MEMKNRLPGPLAIIDNQSIGICDTLLCSNTAGSQHEVSQQGLVRIRCVRQSGDRFLRDHQDMGWCLGIDVPEPQAELILVDDVCRDLPIDYFREDGFHGVQS